MEVTDLRNTAAATINFSGDISNIAFSGTNSITLCLLLCTGTMNTPLITFVL